MRKKYKGSERRKFLRLDYVRPLAYKVCKRKTISKILQGYTSNISHSGLFCNIKEKVKIGDILWLSFDRNTLSICEGMEKRSLVYQNGVVGKIVRIERRKNHTLDVGIQFITREEKNLTHIYPKVHFLKDKAGFLVNPPRKGLPGMAGFSNGVNEPEEEIVQEETPQERILRDEDSLDTDRQDNEEY